MYVYTSCPHLAYFSANTWEVSLTYSYITSLVDLFMVRYSSTNTISFEKLTHWGRVTHTCVDNLTIIGLDIGLSPGWRQAIFWTNADILLIEPLETNFSEISIAMYTFSFKKMQLKMSSDKRGPFCLGLNVWWYTIRKIINIRCDDGSLQWCQMGVQRSFRGIYCWPVFSPQKSYPCHVRRGRITRSIVDIIRIPQKRNGVSSGRITIR